MKRMCAERGRAVVKVPSEKGQTCESQKLWWRAVSLVKVGEAEQEMKLGARRKETGRKNSGDQRFPRSFQNHLFHFN
jgi:hypothetical protein